jgi:hypothetical protein
MSFFDNLFDTIFKNYSIGHPPHQGCHIVLVTTHQNGKKYTKKITNTPHLKNIQTVYKIYQMAFQCTNIFQSKALQNVIKLGLLVRKYTIRQPWRVLRP